MICQGSNATLSVDNISGHTYQWFRDGVSMAGQTTPNLTASLEGDYTCRVTNTILSCSVDTSPYTLTVLTTPVSAFTVDASACVGEVLTYTNSSTFDNRGTAVYSWNFGDGQSSTLQSPTHAYATANAMTTSLGVSYSGVAGCLNSSNKIINVVAAVKPVITPSTTSACAGQDVTLTVTGSFTSLTWDHGPTGTPVTVNQPGTYKVTSVDANTCVDSAQVVIAALPGPTLTLTADKTLIVPSESAQLTASGADTYSWSPAEGLNDPNIANPLATPASTTTYVVSASVTGGCTVQDSVKIEVIVNGNIINPPKFFSPNGDTQNDLWVIPSVDQYPDCTLVIYDVNGRKVYEKTGYANEWNGTFNGNPVPEGTYYYAFGCPDGKRASGNVLIVR
jgi:gliding motility-associated-like protein